VDFVAVHQNEKIQLERQPGDGEQRGNSYAHLGDFASCLLLGR